MTIYLLNPGESEKKLFLETFCQSSVITLTHPICPGRDSYLVVKVSSTFDVIQALSPIPAPWRDHVLFYVSPAQEEELGRVFPYLHFISPLTDLKVLREMVMPSFEKRRPLTEREHEVLYRVATGESCKEISAGLSIKESTVYFYKKKLLRKLNLASTQQLQLYAYLELFIRTPRS
jgi:Response regulator containing a CheY-like receiver domain and an HTH DNA-binding domain